MQSSRSRALIALISGCDAPYNLCKCIPGGAGTSTTSKISDGHRSHLPDHSNAQPGRHRRLCSHRGLARSSRCFWAVSRSTIVACAYPVVLVLRQRQTSVPIIVHISRTIQMRKRKTLKIAIKHFKLKMFRACGAAPGALCAVFPFQAGPPGPRGGGRAQTHR